MSAAVKFSTRRLGRGEYPPRGELEALVQQGLTDADLANFYGRGAASWGTKARQYHGIPAIQKPRRTDNPDRKGFAPRLVDRPSPDMTEPGCKLPTADEIAAWHQGYRFDAPEMVRHA